MQDNTVYGVGHLLYGLGVKIFHGNYNLGSWSPLVGGNGHVIGNYIWGLGV